MKKLTISLLTIVLNFAVYSQQVFTAISTESYEYKDDEWKFVSRTNEVSIPVYIVPRFIHVEAKENAYFLLSKDEPTIINEEHFSGYRSNGYDLRLEKNCVVDIIESKTVKGISIIVITYLAEGWSIRYYFLNKGYENNQNTDR